MPIALVQGIQNLYRTRGSSNRVDAHRLGLRPDPHLVLTLKPPSRHAPCSPICALVEFSLPCPLFSDSRPGLIRSCFCLKGACRGTLPEEMALTVSAELSRAEAWLAAGDVEAAWGAPVSSPDALRRGRDFLRAAALVPGALRGSA